MSSFTAENNACGQTLLHLVARGSAIVAELLRLSSNVPTVFYLNNKSDVDRLEVRKFSVFVFFYRNIASSLPPNNCIWEYDWKLLPWSLEKHTDHRISLVVIVDCFVLVYSACALCSLKFYKFLNLKIPRRRTLSETWFYELLFWMSLKLTVFP